jgi:hypothetical protein
VSNYIVLLERDRQPIQRLQLVARTTADAVSAAMELVPQATTCRVLLEGEW